MGLWWRNLSGEMKTTLVGGAFLVAAAIIGALVTAAFSHSGSGNPVAAPTVTTATPPAPPTVSTSPTVSGSVAPVSLKPRWQGTITIGDPGIELDGLPPTAAQNPNNFTFWDDAGTLDSGNGTFAAWNGPSNPNYAQCHSWVLTHGVTSLELTNGMQICVLTGSGRTAYVTITNLPADGNDASAEATVWNSGT
jgi:hypothetical protein